MVWWQRFGMGSKELLASQRIGQTRHFRRVLFLEFEVRLGLESRNDSFAEWAGILFLGRLLCRPTLFGCPAFGGQPGYSWTLGSRSAWLGVGHAFLHSQEVSYSGCH